MTVLRRIGPSLLWLLVTGTLAVDRLSDGRMVGGIWAFVAGLALALVVIEGRHA